MDAIDAESRAPSPKWSLHMTTRGHKWVLESDIQACFDTIDHVALMNRIRQRITGKNVLTLAKAFLKAGVMASSGDRAMIGTCGWSSAG